MKTIDDILKEKGFTQKESEGFLEIIQEAKMLQRSTQLEDLKPFINQTVNKVIRDDD